MNENKKLWFKRKTYGWGWTPCTWQGWVVIALYLLLILPIFSRTNPNYVSLNDLLIRSMLPFIILTTVLIIICYKKGEKPKWQWGKEKQQARVGTGVMIFKDGKVLLGKRKGAHGSGEYSSPGGHLEYMESLEECARREVLEECGVKIKNLKFLHVANDLSYAPKHFLNITFTADWESGEPQVLEPEKCESWGWYDIDNLPETLYSMTKLAIQSYKTGKHYYDSSK